MFERWRKSPDIRPAWASTIDPVFKSVFGYVGKPYIPGSIILAKQPRKIPVQYWEELKPAEIIPANALTMGTIIHHDGGRTFLIHQI